MLLLLACVAPPTLLLDPDPARTGADGADGPYGAALTTHAYTARVTETVTVDFVYPADGDASAVPLDGGWPLVVFVHGGAVEAERYHWLAAHLASRGYAVGLPHHPLDLAFFEAGNARVAREGLAQDEPLSGMSAIGGHSLGGVVSVIDWVADPAFTAVFLAASYPDDGTDPTERGDSPALSLAGAEDGYASVADVAAGAERFSNVTYGVVDGMTHFDWVDNPTDAELAKDGVSTGTAATRTHALDVVDTFLDASLRGDADAAARLAGPFAGVELL